MNRAEYDTQCAALAAEAEISPVEDSYFYEHQNRVYEWLLRFRLFDHPLGDMLDIGPFFSFTPFLLQSNSRSVTILEGDDPVAGVLAPMYRKRGITSVFTDLNETFGPIAGATRRLPFPDRGFDTILCWETMEHFSFNPVPFLREIKRISKTNASIIIVVPDRASIYCVLRMYRDKPQARLIRELQQTADYISGGKYVFHGHHWREYSRLELKLLVETTGFEILEWGGLQGFYRHQYSARYAPIRVLRKLLFSLSPIFGTDAYVIARPARDANDTSGSATNRAGNRGPCPAAG